MKIVQFLLVIYAANVIDAASIALDQCELDRLLLMYGGGCAIDRQDFCYDLCTGVRIESEEDCMMYDECCWNGDACTMKSIGNFNIPETKSATTEPTVSPSTDVDEDNQNLRRSKRRAGGGFDASVKKDKGGWTATAQGNQDIGSNGNVWAEGRYQHPTGAWGVNAGYEHKIRGGSISAGAGYERNPWGQNNHHISIGFSKRWRK